MEQRNRANAYNKYFDEVCSYLVLNSELEVSEEQLEVSMQNVLAYYEQSVAQYGISLPQYLEMTGKKLEEFKSKNLGEFENEIVKQKVFKFVVENL